MSIYDDMGFSAPVGGGGDGLTLEEANAQFIRNDDTEVVLPGTLGVDGSATFLDGLTVDGPFQVDSATAGFAGALSAASVEIVGATLTGTLTVADDATFQGDVDFGGAVTGLDPSAFGLGNVDNTADTAKPVSTAQAAADALKVAKAGDSMTGALNMATGAANGIIFGGDTNLYRDAADLLRSDDVFASAALYSASVGGTAAANLTLCADLTSANGRLYLAGSANGSVLTWFDAAGSNGVSIGRTAASTLTTSGNLTIGANLTVTGTVTGSGFTKALVGLGSVDNTADTAKPVSTATQTALDLKAPLASPTFTGTVAGVTKTMVGLGSVDNTADTAKPVSTAQAAADALRLPLAGGTMTGSIVSSSFATFADLGVGAADVRATVPYGGIGIKVTGPTAVPLIIRGAAAQSASLTQWEDSAAANVLRLTAVGQLQFGATSDTNLYRDGADLLRTNDEMRVDLALTAGNAAASTANVRLGAVGPAAQACVLFGGDINLYRSSSTVLQCDKSVYSATNIAARSASGQGAVTIGNVGTGATAGILLGTDTGLYRSAADTLKTDDALIVGGSVGFYGGAAAAKQTVTGAKGANDALASLLAGLVAIGLITDSSSA